MDIEKLQNIKNEIINLSEQERELKNNQFDIEVELDKIQFKITGLQNEVDRMIEDFFNDKNN